MSVTDSPKVIRPVIAAVLAVISVFLNLFGLPIIPHGQKLDMSKFTLAWSDEFNGSSLNKDNWGLHCGGGNKTIIRRGSYWDMDLCSVTEDCLHIKSAYYPDGLNGNGLKGWYTAGIDTSGKHEQTYGYFECRCILPKGASQWAAFWMFSGGVGSVGNGGTDGAEIDVFEAPYYYKTDLWHNAVTSTVHWDGYDKDHQQKNICKALADDPYEKFNTYGLEWNKDGYTVNINGVECGHSNAGGASQVAEFLILSVEIGGENAVPADSWGGSAISPNAKQTDFVVDYVRAYQYK